MKKPDTDLPIAKYDKMSKAVLKKQLIQSQIELERYKRRKAIKSVDFIIRNFGKVTPRPIKRLLRTKVVGPGSNTTSSIKKYFSERSSISFQSSYPYSNLRFFGVGKDFRFNGLVQIIDLRPSWQTSLRPGIDSTDGLIVENVGESDEENKILTSAIKEAKKYKLPIISVCHKEEELVEHYVKASDLVVVFDQSLYGSAVEKMDKDKVFYAGVCFDPVVYDPVAWQENPSHNLQVLAKNKLSVEEIISVKKLADKFSKVVIFTGERIRKTINIPIERRLYKDVFEQSKEHLATLCLPGQFPGRLEFEEAVIKLLACGTLVFTTDEEVVKKINVPALVLSDDEALDDALKNPVVRERHSIKSRRDVISRYSETKIIKKILARAKITAEINETVSIILCTNRPDYIDFSIDNAISQTYKDLEFLLVLHGKGFDKKKIQQKLEKSGLKHKIIECPADMIFGECLNKGLDAASGQYVAKFDDDDYYGPEHLRDLVQAHEYSQANVVGKWAHFVYLEDSKTMLNYQADQQEKYVGHIPGGTFLIKRALLEEFRFGRVRYAIDSELWSRLKDAGIQMYSTHRYNYVRVRHGQNTWDVGNEFFLERSSEKKDDVSPEESFV